MGGFNLGNERLAMKLHINKNPLGILLCVIEMGSNKSLQAHGELIIKDAK